MTLLDRPHAPPAPAVVDRQQSAGEFIGKAADSLTLLGFLAVPLFYPNIGGAFGITAADIILGLAVPARAVHILTTGFRPAILRRHSYLLGLLSLFALAGIVSLFVNQESPLTWGYWRLVLSTMGSVLLIATFGQHRTWEENRALLLRAFGLGCLILAFSTLFGPRLQGRPIGFSAHPNSMGHSCIMGIATSVWLAENVKHHLERWFWWGVSAACLFGVMQSGSRGGLAGLWVGIMLYLVLRRNLRAILLAAGATWLAGMLLAFGVVTLPPNNPITRILNQEETGSNLSDQARGQLLEQDIEIISAHPLFGVGFEDDLLIINVHVVYLQGWVAAGALAAFVTIIIGLTALCLPLVMRPKDLALACGAASVAVAWAVTNILQFRDQWMFLACAFGSAQSISVLRSDARQRLPEPLRPRQVEGVA